MQILAPNVEEGPRQVDGETVGYELNASLSSTIMPNPPMFVNLGMSIKAPEGTKFEVAIGSAIWLLGREHERSDRHFWRIRHNLENVSNAVINEGVVIATITVQRLLPQNITTADRIKDIKEMKAVKVRFTFADHGKLNVTKPSGRGARNFQKEQAAVAVDDLTERPSSSGGRLPSNLWRTMMTGSAPTVKLYGGTKPAEEVNL